MSSVKLNEMEMTIARQIGRLRNGANVRNETPNRKVGAESDLEVNVRGFMGEIAAAKLLNVYPDFAIGPNHDPWDMLLDGKTVDVKTRKNGDLVVEYHKAQAPMDIYILMHSEEAPLMRCAGFTTGANLFRTQNLGDHFGNGPCWVLPRKNLRPVNELLVPF